MKLLVVALLLLAVNSVTAGILTNIIGKCFLKLKPIIFKLPYNNYASICQMTSKGTYLTLYNTEKRIPELAVYEFFLKEALIKRKTTWFQLNEKNSLNMDSEGSVDSKVLLNQASNADYKGSGYERGHLRTFSLVSDQDAADSTFALTNAVPIASAHNKAWYNKAEKIVGKTLSEHLSKDKENKAYVISGVVPGDRKLKGIVAIPDFIWTVGLCVSKDGKMIANAFLMDLTKDIPADSITVKLEDLYSFLKKHGYDIEPIGKYIL